MWMTRYDEDVGRMRIGTFAARALDECGARVRADNVVFKQSISPHSVCEAKLDERRSLSDQ